MNKRIAALGITATLLTGGVVGALIGAPGVSNADTSTPITTVTTSAGTAGTPATPGTFTPNTDPAHEAGESAAVEANEKLGIAPNGGHDSKGGPRGHSNTDPAHEAAESPARVAEEAAHDAATTTASN